MGKRATNGSVPVSQSKGDVCPVCRSTGDPKTVVVNFRPRGRSVRIEHEGYECPTCGTKFFDDEQMSDVKGILKKRVARQAVAT
jgi:YgiT-type zinc finger domain-containing protein